jgi:hypothetical protein
MVIAQKMVIAKKMETKMDKMAKVAKVELPLELFASVAQYLNYLGWLRFKCALPRELRGTKTMRRVETQIANLFVFCYARAVYNIYRLPEMKIPYVYMAERLKFAAIPSQLYTTAIVLAASPQNGYFASVRVLDGVAELHNRPRNMPDRGEEFSRKLALHNTRAICSAKNKFHLRRRHFVICAVNGKKMGTMTVETFKALLRAQSFCVFQVVVGTNLPPNSSLQESPEHNYSYFYI